MSLEFEYDPSEVHMTFNGVPIMGFADGSMVMAERDEDGFKKKTGTQGDTVRIKNLNRGGSVTIKLLSGSPTNGQLYALALLDEKDGSGKGVIQIFGLSSQSLVFSATAWIKKLPKVEYSDDETGREWVFDCTDMTLSETPL